MAANPVDKERPATKSGANKWLPVIVIVLALCLALICCALAVGGYFWMESNKNTIVPLPFPLPTATVARIPDIASPEPAEPGGALDIRLAPLFGSTSLQRGFSPDPFSAEVTAGGTVDTSAQTSGCGFTSAAPSYKFSIGGGASDTFLGIFFIPWDGTETTLLVHTPQQEWQCQDGTSFGGLGPAVSFDMAPSGTYYVWVGTTTPGTTADGALYITGTADLLPLNPPHK
jgi:hypothetical protein